MTSAQVTFSPVWSPGTSVGLQSLNLEQLWLGGIGYGQCLQQLALEGVWSPFLSFLRHNEMQNDSFETERLKLNQTTEIIVFFRNGCNFAHLEVVGISIM